MTAERLAFLRARAAAIKLRGHPRVDEVPLLVNWLQEALEAAVPAPVQGQLFAQRKDA